MVSSSSVHCTGVIFSEGLSILQILNTLKLDTGKYMEEPYSLRICALTLPLVIFKRGCIKDDKSLASLVCKDLTRSFTRLEIAPTLSKSLSKPLDTMVQLAARGAGVVTAGTATGGVAAGEDSLTPSEVVADARELLNKLEKLKLTRQKIVSKSL
jgi:hypothetical protein